MNQFVDNAISESDVISYLYQHPDFFQHHLELLETLHVPHPSGNAVSLISKQLDIFREKHQELENQLESLINIARENDTSFNRLHQLTLTLLEATSLEQAIVNMEAALRAFFQTDYVIIRLISASDNNPSLGKLFWLQNDPKLLHFTEQFNAAEPFCGIPNDAQRTALFDVNEHLIKSCAIIPVIYPRINALIAIGSLSETGFHSGMGRIFLTQISEIVATRLISLLPELSEPAKPPTLTEH